jgi:hypothetical protein
MSSSEQATKLDLVVGAKAIAEYLGLANRTVYQLAETYKETGKGLPIRREPGFGVVASRAQLRDYLEARLGKVEEVPNQP